MSWLFKDPIITVIRLNFNHAQWNSKKRPQDKKNQIAPNEIFFLKNNKIFMYLLARFVLQNFKRIVRADPELSA